MMPRDRCLACDGPIEHGLCWACQERRVRLSDDRHVVDWMWLARAPVGAVVHFNSGWSGSSWEAELRALVDDRVAIVRSRVGRRRDEYFVITSIELMVWRNSGGTLRAGELPAELVERD
jgi:hypothetical protein